MHRATPAGSSFRAYSAGGARAMLQKFGEALPADDSKQMQEISASFMKGEVRSKIEHVQQYGFSSVPFDPDPEKDGKPGMGPETFIQFLGGNRSFPVAGPVDDRRHRLKGLKPGDVSLFRGKDDGIQLTLTALGMVISHVKGKKFRTQIVDKAGAAAGGVAKSFAEGDSASGGQAQASEEMGQKPIFDSPSEQYFEVDDNGTTSANKTITDVAETGLTAAVRNGEISQVASKFKVGAPDARLRAGETPTPVAPTAFDIIGTASASSPIPAGTRTTQLATTEFVGAAIDAASSGTPGIGPPGPQGPPGAQGPPGDPLANAPQLVTGSIASGAAFASLMGALVALGLIDDQTSP
jgi:phage gp45-like